MYFEHVFIFFSVQVLLRRSNSVDHMATQPHQLHLSDKKGVFLYDSLIYKINVHVHVPQISLI